MTQGKILQVLGSEPSVLVADSNTSQSRWGWIGAAVIPAVMVVVTAVGVHVQDDAATRNIDAEVAVAKDANATSIIVAKYAADAAHDLAVLSQNLATPSLALTVSPTSFHGRRGGCRQGPCFQREQPHETLTLVNQGKTQARQITLDITSPDREDPIASFDALFPHEHDLTVSPELPKWIGYPVSARSPISNYHLTISALDAGDVMVVEMAHVYRELTPPTWSRGDPLIATYNLASPRNAADLSPITAMARCDNCTDRTAILQPKEDPPVETDPLF
jgi:hypothetical protein